MKRISRNQMLQEMVRVVAKRSSCLRLQVGALVARDGRVLSSGYNGAPSGLPHCSPETCGPDRPCTATVHAEAGAIAYAARHGIPIEGSSLYCTNSPCLDCAKLIINAGIIHVDYQIPYRVIEGIELLKLAGIRVTNNGD